LEQFLARGFQHCFDLLCLRQSQENDLEQCQ
jgi:hypothetical protein